MRIEVIPYIAFLLCFASIIIYGFMITPLNLSGKGAAVLFVIMLIALVLIAPTYAISDSYTKESLTKDWLGKIILGISVIVDILAVPFFCWLMYKKIKKNYCKKRKEQLIVWIKSLNRYYERKISGFNKILNLIKEKYANEKKIENLLELLELCGADGMVCKFHKAAHDENLLIAVNKICKEYDLKNELSDLIVAQLFKDVNEEKNKCYGYIYDENALETYDYQVIKKEFQEYCE